MAGSNTLSQRRDLYILNTIFCLQVSAACSQACPALLDDTAPIGLNHKSRVFCIAQHVAIQIYIAAALITVDHRNASIFLADKSNFYRFIRFHGEGIGLCRGFLGSPGRMVLGVGPQFIPVSSFFPAACHLPGRTGGITFQNGAELCIHQLVAVCIRIPVGYPVHKIPASKRTSVGFIEFLERSLVFIFRQRVRIRTGLPGAPEQRFRYFFIVCGLTLFLSQGPVIAQVFLGRIGFRIVHVIPANGFAGRHVLIQIRAFLQMAGIIRYRLRPGPAEFRPGILRQVGNGNLSFNIVVKYLAQAQVGCRFIRDRNFRAAVYR